MDWEVLESDQIGPESRLYRPKSRLKASSKPTDPDVRSKLPSRKLFLNEAPTGFESFDVRGLAQNLALDDLKASSKFTDPDVRSRFTSLSRLIRDKARTGFDVRKPALIDSKASFTPTNPDGRSRLTSRKLVLDDSKASFTPTGSTLTNPEIRTTTKTILPNALLNNLPQANCAAYDAESSGSRRSCTAMTSEKILVDLVAWAADIGDRSIFWLNGKAGIGKTTIAFTFSQILDNLQILGASFFCSRLDTDSSNAKLIFPTLAYQLARHSAAASNALLNALQMDRNVGHKSMRDQFLDLIATPTKAAYEGVSTPRPLIIVIDALDECDNQDDLSGALAIIRQYSPILPLKFFITSRPEEQIQNVFRQEGNSKYTLHEIDEDIVSADIATYVGMEMAIIRGRMSRTPYIVSPPEEDRLKALVHLSGTLFIYAATACKYIGGGESIVERLEDVIDISPNSPSSETSALDDLYGRILSAAFRANAGGTDEIKKVLRAVISVRTPLSINGLSKLLRIEAHNVVKALSPLRSVVYIPENMDVPVTMFHTSFTDFITTEKRSGEHFLEPSKSHHMVGLHCLWLLQSSLVENICQLKGRPGLVNADISDYISPLAVKDRIPEALIYACVNWASHVANIESEVTIDDWDDLYRFFDEKLLQWFECLSLLNRLGDAVSSLQKLEAWIPVCGCSISMRIAAEQQIKGEHNLRDVVVDARWFIEENFALVGHHPRKIYSSALVLLPEQSYFWMKYGNKRSTIRKGSRKVWRCEQVLRGHSDNIFSVAFSPDGCRIVSGSNDNTVRIWDVATCELEAELGHSDSVYSVNYSLDGSRIVSGSFDNTVRIWNAVTGEVEAELKGHLGEGYSVVFSPDGNHVASGSRDNAVRIWNAVTGEVQAELKGHFGEVYSAVFSPDGSRVVSGSADNTIHIWNVVTGVFEKELKGHSGGVHSVNFSPDGSHVVSGSSDNTVCIWNVATAECEVELRGHSGSVNSVGFSPDGSCVVSGSIDNTVRIWNVMTGEVEAEMKGHLDEVYSVVFSPDGSHVVSGSADNTIRLWKGSIDSVIFSPKGSYFMSGSFDNIVQKVEVAECEVELRGHSGRVNSVVFSPDGSHVVSGSIDSTVRIWNAVTGEVEAELKGHLGEVHSVIFSPDGSHVVSGSIDSTVRIWNAVTGEVEAELKGHLGSVHSVNFSPDGSHVVSGSSDNTVRIWNMATAECEVELRGHSGGVNSVGFSPDGSRVVSGSIDNTVRIWNVMTGEVETEMKGHMDEVYSVVFSPDGSHVVSGSADSTIHFWNVVTGVVSKLPLRGHLGEVYSAVFFSGGSRVVSGSADDIIRIWNVKMGRSTWSSESDLEVPCYEQPASRINADSSFDIVKSDRSEHSPTTTCWIAAENALNHARNNESSVSRVFERWKIKKSEYIVLAGFDESLIKSGVGYLEQIHVTADVDATSSLLSELGKLFSPFSSILFTEFSLYRLPVFKDDGSVWEFDELVYFTASKFADGGSSAKIPLTIISLSQSQSLADTMTVVSQSSSGSGEGEENKKQSSEKGKERDKGDKDEAGNGEKDNKDPSDDPEGDQGGIIAGLAKISFEIASEIHPAIYDDQNIFQTLTMHGSLTIETTPLAQNPPQFSERFVQFTRLALDTEPTTDIAYKQFHLRVVVDSQQENADIEVIKPRRTSDSNGEELQSSSMNSGWTRGMSAGLTLGPHPQAEITGTATKTKEETVGVEKKRYTSTITEHRSNGNVRWGFNIDDVNLQKWGIDMQKDVLPTVRFEFIGDDDKPAPPPKYMDIAVTSYWSMILPSEPKRTFIHKLLRFFNLRSTGNSQTTFYSNIFQIIALKADLFNLSKPSHYRAIVKVRSGASDPPVVKRRAADSVDVTLAVVDDPQKLSNYNLPKIAKFRLSDNCIPILENSSCNNKSHYN